MYDKIKELTGSFKTPMGCRSFLQGWTDPETSKEVNSGRMNLWGSDSQLATDCPGGSWR